jgi:hypothetical protein
MNTPPAGHAPTTDLPSAAACDRYVTDARQIFHRTLASWASDVLVLRQQGLHEPAWTARQSPHDMPHAPAAPRPRRSPSRGGSIGHGHGFDQDGFSKAA